MRIILYHSRVYLFFVLIMLVITLRCYSLRVIRYAVINCYYASLLFIVANRLWPISAINIARRANYVRSTNISRRRQMTCAAQITAEGAMTPEGQITCEAQMTAAGLMTRVAQITPEGQITEYYLLAYSTARVSRMTITRICPGKVRDSSIFLTMSRLSNIESSSEMTSLCTITRSSRPA
jgi:hypothetical protein